MNVRLKRAKTTNKMNKNGDGNIFMEVYDRIHSVDLVLRGNDHPKHLEIHPNKLVTKQKNGIEEIFPLVVEIEPSSCTSILRHENEGIGVRLQLRDSNPEPKTAFLSTSVKRVGGQVELMEKGFCQCGCKTCGLRIFVSKVKFNRVLPLPSQTWREMYNNWSCCGHSVDKGEAKVIPSYVAQSVIKPRETDCLLGEFNMVVHSNVVKKQNIFLRKPKTKTETDSKLLVKCSRCRSELGEAHKIEDKLAAFELNKSCIEVLSLSKEDDCLTVSEFFLERLIAQQFSNAVLAHTTHMFVMQDYDHNAHLLVRVVNTNTRLFVNNGDNDLFDHLLENNQNYNSSSPSSEDETIQPYRPLDHSRPPYCGSGDYNHNETDVKSPVYKISEKISNLFSFSSHLIEIGGASKEIQAADTTGCERIVKVMYGSTCSAQIERWTEKWLKDERTLTLTYPKHICVQILLVLLSSTLTMPVAHSRIGDFAVGYLRLD